MKTKICSMTPLTCRSPRRAITHHSWRYSAIATGTIRTTINRQPVKTKMTTRACDLLFKSASKSSMEYCSQDEQGDVFSIGPMLIIDSSRSFISCTYFYLSLLSLLSPFSRSFFFFLLIFSPPSTINLTHHTTTQLLPS